MTDTPITQAERDELKRLHNAATPAPWMGDWCIISEEGDVIARTDVSVASDPAVADNDGPLIIAARNALPRLLAALEAAEAERKEVQGILNASVDACGLEPLMSLPGAITRLRAERDSLKTEIDMAQGEAEHALGGPRESLLAAVREVCQERDSLKAELADWRDSAKTAAGESCGDERHCTCVGPLREELKDTKSKLATLVEAVTEVIAKVDADPEPFTQSAEDRALELRVRAAIEAAKVTT